MDVIDTVFDDLNQELFPGLDRNGRRAAMALAVRLSEGRSSGSGSDAPSDGSSSGTYSRLRVLIKDRFSDAALTTAGTRIRHFATGNLAILLAYVCPSLVDRSSFVHDSGKPEYEGIRQMYSSLRRLAVSHFSDRNLQEIGRSHKPVLAYLLNGRK